ncbi:TIM-barrel domain-containing protein [Pelagicoccus sp. SDUM812003]|uniref:TIM-barrel domain-containing protein n=1 Tax=Pelagicoccus sp. SDUM812003 TaxID=3041267 RepID=UPI00280DDFF8|nr:TIM-barrel domain-containing protein [Pelagicoccus sp. SDUM812003]MDQ8203275.1 glycoside hydrolase family 31 protein [Pelagicoccus sp. SDUM812003]
MIPHPTLYAFAGCRVFLAATAAFVSALAAVAETQLENAGAALDFEDSDIVVSKAGDPILRLISIRFDYHDPISMRLVSRDESSLILEALYPSAVEFNNDPNDQTPRPATIEIREVPGGFRIHSSPTWADQCTLVLQDLGDHFFGLSEPLQPDNQKSPDLRGSSIRVEVASEGQSIVENYASAMSSFYLSSFGYGAFFDTFARGRYDLAVNGANRIHHDTGELDWYLFFGDDGVEVHRHYFALIGDPKPLPLWGLGPVAWRDQNDGGSKEILGDISRMSDLRIPLTSWFVDRPYSDGHHAWSEMNFSKSFAHPKKWIQTIREDFGLEFMTWTSTAMFGSERFPKHLAGAFTYLDLSHPETVEQFQSELAKKQYAHGVKGHKMDRADEVFPLYEHWHDRSIGPAERRNRYVYLFTKVHHEALQEAWGDDQVNFARAGIHRAQPYLSALWGGDPRSNWQGLQSNIANGIRCSFMGFPVWGTDVGGYLGEGFIDEELYIRWLQAGSVNGLFEIKLDGAGGDGEDRMPWRYGKRLQSAFRTVCEERMSMLPYLYSISHNARETGAVMQPMAYRHLDDPRTYAIWDQFYFGPNILVAPVLEKAVKRSVYFPAGTWIDFDDPSQRLLIDTPQRIEVDAPLGKLPRWIKANSILVTGDVYQGNAKRWQDRREPRLTIKAFPGIEGESCLFEYIDPFDENAKKRITLERSENKVRVTAPSIACPVTVEIYDPAENGKPVAFSLEGPIDVSWELR